MARVTFRKGERGHIAVEAGEVLGELEPVEIRIGDRVEWMLQAHRPDGSTSRIRYAHRRDAVAELRRARDDARPAADET